MRIIWLCLLALLPNLANAKTPYPEAIDAAVHKAMAETSAKGLAIAVIDEGKVAYVKAYGVRNAKGEPLQTDTIMYGASLTKAVFAYSVMQQVDLGKINLDSSISTYLPKPLPEYYSPDIENRYANWTALDERWKKLTPRIFLTHSSGFANFGFTEPDEKLHFHFDPGARFAYSGDGLITDQIFKGLGMTRTSLIWRPDFAGNLADGWDEKGQVEAHDERSKVRAAGSMDTTIADFAKFAAAYVRGDGLSKASRAELTKRQLHITTKSQFLTFQPELPPEKQRKDLYAGLGIVVFDGPQGHGFFKGGHNDVTANTWVCVEKGQKCVVILSNDVRSEKAFPALVKAVLGETGVPYEWEYGFTPIAQ
jgi:CubicO group peptidase (beta-lactamase class C family)